MMDWPGIRRLLQLPERLRSVEREVDDELRFHVESRVDDLVRRGRTREAAREEAAREFGDIDAARRELTSMDRTQRSRSRFTAWLDALRQDALYAVRGIVRTPAFSLTVVVTMGLGIGANATMFGIIDRLMLRAAPHVQDADRLRHVYHRAAYAGMGAFNQRSRSYRDFVDLQGERDVFDAVGAYWESDVSVGRGLDAQKSRALLVTAGLFPMIGVQPAVGRFFTPDEDRPPRGAAVVVLSYGYWQRVYGRDPAALGTRIDVLGEPFTIIGVAPPAFRGLGTGAIDLFLPMTAAASRIHLVDGAPDDAWRTTYGMSWLHVIVRLAHGVNEASAASRATTVFRRAHADSKELTKADVGLASVIPGRGPQRRPEDRVAVWLTGVAAMVLLIAMANVSNLLLTRGARRRREIAVRMALGIGRRRLFGQLLVESVLLAVFGAVAALLLTRWGGNVVRATLMPNLSPDDPVVDVRVFAVAAFLAIVGGVVTGLAPLWLATRTDVVSDLKSGAREGTYRRSRLRVGLLVAQASLSVVLLVGAVLFVRSMRNAINVPVGYDTRRVLVADVDVASIGYTTARAREYFARARDRVSHLADVESASLAAFVPFMSSWSPDVRIEGLDSIPPLAGGGPYASAVSANYFQTMGIRLRRGRLLNAGDVRGAPRVAVINESMARVLWKDRDPVGACIYVLDDAPPSPPCTQVVGIVADGRRFDIAEESTFLFYLSLDQDSSRFAPRLLVRIRDERRHREVTTQVAREMQGLGDNLPYADVRLMQDIIDPQYQSWRLGATLFVVFGGIALVLAAIGLYSVVAYDAAQRMHEFGVRIALGARRDHIVRMILLDGLRSAGLGTALGVALAVALGGSVSSLLFRVSPRDPVVLGAAAIVMLLVALAACVRPAWRATQVQPGQALRTD